MTLSMDIREKVMKAIDGGMSCRQAAARFDIGPATAVRWAKRVETTGDVAPMKMGGDRRSRRIEAHADFILGQIEAQPDVTIMELREKIREAPQRRLRLWNGVAVPGATRDHAQEEDRPCSGAGKRRCRQGARGVV